MPGEKSDEQIIVEHPKPFCLPTTVDVDSTIKLEIEHARNPLPHGTLGDIGLATKVEGPFEFTQHILTQPFQSHALKGIDPTSVRVFRWDEHAGTLRPIWNSGISVAFGFVWAKKGDCEQMMEHYEPILSFGEDTAEIYDTEPDAGHRGETLATVSFLEQLAGGGPALELAIGTGRVALPLAARGVRVDGIDFSPQWSPSYAPSRVATRFR